MVCQNLGGQRHGVPSRDGPIRPHFQSQAVVIGHIAHAGVFHHIIDLINRRIEGIHRDQPDHRLGGLVAIGQGITAAMVDGQLHCEFGFGHQRADVMIRVEDLHLAVAADVAGRHRPWIGRLDVNGLLALAVQLGDDLLYIQHNLRHVFLHARYCRKLMLHAIDLDGSHGGAGQRGKQYTAERVAEGSPISPLQRLHHKFAVGTVFQGIGALNAGLFNRYHQITLLSLKCQCVSQ